MDKKSIKHRNLNQDVNEGLQPEGGLHLTKVIKEEGPSEGGGFRTAMEGLVPDLGHPKHD